MSIAKQTLEEAIFIALQAAAANPATTPAAANAKLREIAANLGTAIDSYVLIKLNALSLQLKNPAAYVGASAAGPVTIAPTAIAAYDPQNP